MRTLPKFEKAFSPWSTRKSALPTTRGPPHCRTVVRTPSREAGSRSSRRAFPSLAYLGSTSRSRSTLLCRRATADFLASGLGGLCSDHVSRIWPAQPAELCSLPRVLSTSCSLVALTIRKDFPRLRTPGPGSSRRSFQTTRTAGQCFGASSWSESESLFEASETFKIS